jgi:mannose-6-phosphate isomerase
MWYALDGMEDSYVYLGLQPGVDRVAFLNAVATETLPEVLRRVPVAAGDALFVPGGRVHAIGEGCLLLEVQQNSNTTYRIYDWGRVDADGKGRPLHVEEALQVIRWDDRDPVVLSPRPMPSVAGAALEEIVARRHFRVERMRLNAAIRCANDGSSFHAVFVARGAIGAESKEGAARGAAGTTLLLPAALSEYRLAPEAGPAELLRVSVPSAPPG